MKGFILLVFVPGILWAQVNIEKADSMDNTTIEIRKGDKSKIDNKYEITEGTDEVAGDSAPLMAAARTSWKKACDGWKKEFKDLNKDNQILSMNCGKPTCTRTEMESVCTSDAKYKLKVQVR
jgi:hypothetical protein